MGLRALFTGITLGTATILVLWYYEMQIYFGFKVAVAATLILYLSVPILFRLSPSVQRHLVFLPFVRWPSGVNFSDPKSEGLAGGRNIYLEPEPGSTIGVWHLLPSSEVNKSEGQSESFWDESLKESGKHIILYLHGNSGSRAGEHRKELYTLLQNLDFHVVAFDYRGYADSTQIPPSETTTVTDGIYVYKWLRSVLGSQSNNVHIFLWGHSLGTGVSSKVASRLCLEDDPPTNLILESPFTSIGEEVKHHMLAALWRYMPFFDDLFVHPLKENDFGFESDRNIANIYIPILILHAVDDPVVPYFLGKKLYNIGITTRNSTAKPLYFKAFGQGYAHKFICRSPELPPVLMEFYRCSIENTWPCKAMDEAMELNQLVED